MDSPASSAAAVLGDDDLLIEILLRLDSPTFLVRAVLVCKRWLHHASHRAFLRCFRRLHPPRLLGFYLKLFPISVVVSCPLFVPMPLQPPELAAAVRRAATYSLDSHAKDSTWTAIRDCRNGSLFVVHCRRTGEITYGVHTPLCPQRGMAVVFPPLPLMKGNLRCFAYCLSREEGDGGLSYLLLSGELNEGNKGSTINVYMLQDGSWCMHTSATAQLTYLPKPMLAGYKIYMTRATERDILVLDLMASSFSKIQFPQGVERGDRHPILSRADDDHSAVYLIHAKKLQLRVWLYKGDNWLLVDTICLREMCAAIVRMSDITVERSDVIKISHVGDNAEFVFLEMDRCVLYLNIKCRELRKVYEVTEDGHYLGGIHPFMMIWPPTFPALKDDPSRNAA